MMFAAPTVLIMASWNSLPGEPMFGVKRAFEQGLVFFVKPSYTAEASLNMQYTKRRMEEANVLLAKNQSAEGLTYLSQQIKTTKKMIQRAPTQEKKREAAKQYITTLQGVSQELKKQQKTTRTVALNSSAKSAKTTGMSQEQLQALLQQQLYEVQQMQVQLQSQIQQPQTPQLLAQLAAQSQQLERLRYQLDQPQQQVQVAQALATQIAESNAIQDQVDVVAPSPDDAVDTIQEEIDTTIDDLEDLSTQADTVPEDIVPTTTSVPTSTPTEEPTSTLTPDKGNDNDNRPDKDKDKNNGNRN